MAAETIKSVNTHNCASADLLIFISRHPAAEREMLDHGKVTVKWIFLQSFECARCSSLSSSQRRNNPAFEERAGAAEALKIYCLATFRRLPIHAQFGRAGTS